MHALRTWRWGGWLVLSNWKPDKCFMFPDLFRSVGSPGSHSLRESILSVILCTITPKSNRLGFLFPFSFFPFFCQMGVGYVYLRYRGVFITIMYNDDRWVWWPPRYYTWDPLGRCTHILYLYWNNVRHPRVISLYYWTHHQIPDFRFTLTPFILMRG